MLWLTRSHVHVDRVACPWLVRRFIDSKAQFLFVPKSQIDQAAKETGAIPFDAPEVELGHHHVTVAVFYRLWLRRQPPTRTPLGSNLEIPA